MRLLLLLFLAACVHRPEERCRTCSIVDATHPYLKPLKPGTKTLFILVPGALGYGWEWDHAVDTLNKRADVDFVVFWWDPWKSIRHGAFEMRERLLTTFKQLPPSVSEIIVVAHSVGGNLAAHGVAGFTPPRGRRLKLVTIGAPFAGIMGPPFSLDDAIDSPAMMSAMGTFKDYPRIAPNVEVIEYITSYPSDPVMQRRWWHDVAPPDIGPSGAKRIEMNAKMDHNDAVNYVVEELLSSPPATK